MYTSPAIDLLYFFGTSLSDEVESRKNEIIQEYHKTLVHTMLHIGCKTPPLSLQALHKQHKDRAAHEMVATITLLPVLLLKGSEILILNELVSTTEKKVLSSLNYPRYRQILKRRLPMYDDLDLFDI